jgi:hypothetical protein
MLYVGLRSITWLSGIDWYESIYFVRKHSLDPIPISFFIDSLRMGPSAGGGVISSPSDFTLDRYFIVLAINADKA